jgi:hypothetical protein
MTRKEIIGFFVIISLISLNNSDLIEYRYYRSLAIVQACSAFPVY